MGKTKKDMTPDELEEKNRRQREYNRANREKLRQRATERRQERSEECIALDKKKAKGYTLKRRYGLTVDDLIRLVRQQGGMCRLCCRQLQFSAGFGKNCHIDHCHTTGIVRGVLCGRCNTALGALGDDTQSVERVLSYVKGERPSWFFYGVSTAFQVAARATCSRLQVGCVLMTEDNHIFSTGYNGAPAGEKHCDHTDNPTEPCTLSVHAERNAVEWASANCSHLLKNATACLTHAPCLACAQCLAAAGVSRVIYSREYRSRSGLDFLRKEGVEVVHL